MNQSTRCQFHRSFRCAGIGTVVPGLFVLAVVVSGPAATCAGAADRADETDKAEAAITIVTFGDSTTARRGALKVYSEVLRRELPGRKMPATVINAGVGGNTTRAGRARFERDVLKHRPDVVVLQFGINDSAVDVWRKPPATAPRVPREEYIDNLRYFIRQLKAANTRVIVMTPNPLRWTAKLKQLYGRQPYDTTDEDGFNTMLRDYAAAVRQLAAAEQVTLVDIDLVFRRWKGEGGIDALLLDGMHPNAAGHRLIADRLLTVLTAPDQPAAATGESDSGE